MVIIGKSVIISFFYDIVLFAFTKDFDLFEYCVSFIDIVYALQLFFSSKHMYHWNQA